jgi:hypothetical protein
MMLSPLPIFEEEENINKLRWPVLCYLLVSLDLLKKTHGLNPRANYTDLANLACPRSDCQRFADRGCHVVSVTDPYGRILGFLDRSRWFSIK